MSCGDNKTNIGGDRIMLALLWFALLCCVPCCCCCFALYSLLLAFPCLKLLRSTLLRFAKIKANISQHEHVAALKQHTQLAQQRNKS
jgi:hypothetical protein